MEQLCLNLGEVPYAHNGRGIRPIPEIVKELFVVDDSVPSGLVWKVSAKNGKCKAGDMAGVLLKGTRDKYQVSVRGHGIFYTHRIVYFLKTDENPGSMIVRHLQDNKLALGWQSDNGRDANYTTKTMYTYKGNRYNLRALCRQLGLKYPQVYQKLKRTKATCSEVFASYGIRDVEQVSLC